jgi:hypothetical protein
MTAKRIEALPLDVAAWLSDAELRCLPMEARGCLIDLMCYAHQGQPYGHVSVSGVPMTDEMIARLLLMSEPEWKRIKKSLVDSHRIYIADHNGSIYIKRMVRDYEQKMLATEGGKKGGNPQLLLLSDSEEPSPKSERSKPITAQMYWNKLPMHLQTAEMRDAVNEWHEYRIRKKITLTRDSMTRQISILIPLSAAQAVVWIHTAIDRNWRGIFPPPNGDSSQQTSRPNQTTPQAHRAETAKKEYPKNAKPKIL